MTRLNELLGTEFPLFRAVWPILPPPNLPPPSPTPAPWDSSAEAAWMQRLPGEHTQVQDPDGPSLWREYHADAPTGGGDGGYAAEERVA